MRQFKILAVCGAGLATSTYVAKTTQEGLASRNINSVIRTCSVGESNGVILNYEPDVIITTVSTNAVTPPEGVKVFSGVPIMTGINCDKTLDDITDYLKGKE